MINQFNWSLLTPTSSCTYTTATKQAKRSLTSTTRTEFYIVQIDAAMAI